MHLGGARQRTTHPALKSQRLGHGILEYQRRRYDLGGWQLKYYLFIFQPDLFGEDEHEPILMSIFFQNGLFFFFESDVTS